jgi:hypothetical protein
MYAIIRHESSPGGCEFNSSKTILPYFTSILSMKLPEDNR